MANEVEIVISATNQARPPFRQLRDDGAAFRDHLLGISRDSRRAFDTTADGARRAARQVDELGDEARGTSTELGTMGKVGDMVGTVIRAGMAAAAVAVGVTLVAAFTKAKDFALQSRDAAVGLGESYNAVNKIFQSQAQVILDWGKSNANAFGLSQRAFNEMATPLGAMLKNNGFALQDVSKYTIELTKRAADMASVFNTDVMDALMAIQAGLRGESDPLERYGVSLNEARVQAEALATTGKKSAEKLTDQEKAAARLALIFKQTNDVAGDFQQTSDGLANSTRILTARNEELKAKVGEQLMPVFLKWNEIKLRLVETLGDKLGPAIEKVIGWFREIAERVGPSVSREIERIKDITEKYDDEIKLIKEQLKDLIPIIAVSLVAALQIAVTMFEGLIRIAAVMAHHWQIMKDVTRQWIDTFLNMVGIVLDGAVKAFGWIPGLGPKLKQAQADFAQFRDAVNRTLDGIKDKTVTVKVVMRETTSRGLPGGGPAVPGYQTGGNASGLIFVGERGREAMEVPAGTRIRSPEDTSRMAGRMVTGMTAGRMVIEVVPVRSGDQLLDKIVEGLSFHVRTSGGDFASAFA